MDKFMVCIPWRRELLFPMRMAGIFMFIPSCLFSALVILYVLVVAYLGLKNRKEATTAKCIK